MPVVEIARRWKILTAYRASLFLRGRRREGTQPGPEPERKRKEVEVAIATLDRVAGCQAGGSANRAESEKSQMKSGGRPAVSGRSGVPEFINWKVGSGKLPKGAREVPGGQKNSTYAEIL